MKNLTLFAFFGFALLALYCVETASAAEIFNRAQPSENENAVTPVDPSPKRKIYREEPAADTQAPAAGNTDTANTYYKNCLRQQNPVLQGEEQALFCACTSAQVQQHFTAEQMKLLRDNTPEGQEQRARMTLNVYAPCIEFPTQALIRSQCLATPQVKASVPNYTAVCQCLGNEMGQFMKAEGPDALRQALARNPDNIDPLRTLLESGLFEDNSQAFMSRCIQKHALNGQ